MTADDFVSVRLTEAGEAAAGRGEGACVRVHGANYEYCFEPGKTVRVPAAEFRARLEAKRLDGQKIFTTEAAQSAEKKRGSGKA